MKDFRPVGVGASYQSLVWTPGHAGDVGLSGGGVWTRDGGGGIADDFQGRERERRGGGWLCP